MFALYVSVLVDCGPIASTGSERLRVRVAQFEGEKERSETKRDESNSGGYKTRKGVDSGRERERGRMCLGRWKKMKENRETGGKKRQRALRARSRERI